MPPKSRTPMLLDLLPPPTQGSVREHVSRIVDSVADAWAPPREPGGDDRPADVAAGAPVAHVVVRGPAGEEHPLPALWERAVLRMLEEALAGHHVEVRVSADGEIGTQRLANLLGVSRPTAAALLDSEEIASSHRTPGGHRRVSLTDVAAYLARRDRQRASIAALVDHGLETGLPLGTPAHRRGNPDDDE